MGMDAIFLWKPDRPGEPGEYGTKYRATDRFTKLILNNVAGASMELETGKLLFNGDKTISDAFTSSVFAVTDSLFKANGHVVDYKDKEKGFEKRFKRTVIKDPNKGKFDMFDDPLELANQFDGYLIQIKAALDNLARAINPLLGTTFQGWSAKEVEGVKTSGARILKELKERKQSELEPLIRHLEDSMKDITYLVDLRDKPVHFGGNGELRGFFYSQADKKITTPIIRHPDGRTESIRDFVNATFEQTIVFISKVILYSIQYKAPKGMYIEQFIDPRGDTAFRWKI